VKERPGKEFGFDTRSIHAGQRPEPYTGARAVPIFQTTSYVFEDPDSASAYFNLQEYGNTYSRIMNPTTAVFEERVANLERAAGGVASLTQLKHLARKLGLEITFVDPDDLDHWRAALRPNTKVLYGETIGNPGGNVLDIQGVAEIAHGHGAPLMVDSTFATPYLCRPIEWGADIVTHSATKFIGGHGTSIGGIAVEAGSFDWSNGRFGVVADPSPAYHGLAFHETFGVYGYLMKLRAESLRDLGAALSPFNAFLFLLGLETLPLRMARHVENATAVATWLETQPGVTSVRYPGLPSSKYKRLADKYLPLGAGAIFSFDLPGGRDAGRRFIEALDIWSHLANVGDAKSLVIHPASTTHRQLSDEELSAAGIAAGTIRLSVGLESAGDLIADLEGALRAVSAAPVARV
jgi:O-acetylhomoserine (thiol)-lyase